MTAAAPIKARLPLDPVALAAADLEPLDRGRLYNDLDLDGGQRACAEEARRLVLAGLYDGGSADALAAHLVHEREVRAELGRPARSRGARA